MSSIRVAILLPAAFVVVLAAGTPALAQDADIASDSIIVIKGRAEVRPGESLDTVFIASGPAVVDGTVRDNVIALNGDVVVRGTVEGEVVAFNGQVTVGPTGTVRGDVVSRQRPVVADGGHLDGSWQRWNAAAFRRGVAVGARVVLWIAFTISTFVLGLLLGLLFPRPAVAAERAARGNLGASIGWGLLLTLGLPVVAVLVMLTLVGLPLGLGVLGALGLVYGVAYVTAARVLGRLVAPRASSFLAFLAGWAILRAIAIVPFLGGLVGFAAVVVGLGAIAVAAYRAHSGVAAEAPPPGHPVPG